MSFLPALPKYLLLDVCQRWLQLNELCFLDSAICNSFDREPFSEKVFLEAFIFKEFESSKPLSNYLKWLGYRNLTVETLNLVVKIYDSEAVLDHHFSKKALNKIKKLTIISCDMGSDEIVKSLLSSCTSLNEINFPTNHNVYDTILNDSLIDFIVNTHGSQLEVLNLFGCQMLQKSTLANILSSCCQLKSLEFAFYKGKQPLILQKNQIKCTKLISFKTQFSTIITDNCMELLTSHCPDLHTISISVSNCKTLSHFKL